MIIQSRSVLSKPESASLTHLGDYSEGHVYKTERLSDVQAANPDAEISEVPSENMPVLRRVLFTAVELNRKTQEKIRSKYSLEDELGAIRTNNQEYKTFIDQVIAEHNAAKDALFSV
jgi:hypothetical protein